MQYHTPLSPAGIPPGCLAVEQPARLDAGVDRHSAYTELLQVVAIEVQPEALQVLHELVAAQTRARAPQ